MKYMLLIDNNPATYESFSEEERNALFGEVDRLMKELSESGEWIAGEGWPMRRRPGRFACATACPR